MSIGEEAIQKALDRAELGVEDVGLFIFTTTTGLATPSIDARLVEPVERYAASNLQISRTTGRASAFLDGLWFRTRYRDLYREVREGVQQTGRLVTFAAGVGGALTALDLPPVLDELVRQLLSRVRDLPRLDGSSSTAG